MFTILHKVQFGLKKMPLVLQEFGHKPMYCYQSAEAISIYLFFMKTHQMFETLKDQVLKQ